MTAVEQTVEHTLRSRCRISCAVADVDLGADQCGVKARGKEPSEAFACSERSAVRAECERHISPDASHFLKTEIELTLNVLKRLHRCFAQSEDRTCVRRVDVTERGVGCTRKLLRGCDRIFDQLKIPSFKLSCTDDGDSIREISASDSRDCLTDLVRPLGNAGSVVDNL